MRGLRTTLGTMVALVFALVLPLALVASWADTEVDDTDAYVENVSDVARDEVVRAEVVDRLGTAVTAAVEGRLGGVELPAAVQEVVDATVEDVLDSDELVAAWEEANRSAHEQFLAIMDGRGDGESFEVSLRPLLDAALEELGARGVPTGAVPEGAMTFRVASGERLADVRDGYTSVVGAGTLLPVLAVVLLVVALALPAGRSRLGVGLVAAIGAAITSGALLAVLGVGADVAELQVDPADRDLASAVLEVLLAGLRTRALTALVVAVVVAVLLVVALAVVRRRRPAAPPRAAY
ncbi:hypothetical protein INN71_06535 [Nocardioides sp. ChNu-153]|uniref:hypothetical protein n=1 Tax=unclassified Nocardioides TaxID=2615069 RepID=UPI0024049844|nr:MULTISPECIES: hypothetical protein [unclassified Nocardioides]MDF9715177.1 hypothetical protein [Nocardioides sp. ChNu-99]MDN7121044.1 hypothetical protein [Nocardioides sp. ChNu-153]